MAKAKPQNMYNGVRKRFEMMNISVGHIQNRVYVSSCNSFRLSFSTQKHFRAVTRDEMLRMGKNIKNGQNKAPKICTTELEINSKSCIFE